MAERDPIDLIRELLNRVDGLTGLHAEHELFTIQAKLAAVAPEGVRHGDPAFLQHCADAGFFTDVAQIRGDAVRDIDQGVRNPETCDDPSFPDLGQGVVVGFQQRVATGKFLSRKDQVEARSR